VVERARRQIAASESPKATSTSRRCLCDSSNGRCDNPRAATKNNTLADFAAWAMALHAPFQNAVPERPSLDGVAPLQVQAGRLVSSPFGPWYANSPKSYCRRVKLDDARRVGEDEIKQEIAVVTSRHGSEDRSAAEGVW